MLSRLAIDHKLGITDLGKNMTRVLTTHSCNPRPASQRMYLILTCKPCTCIELADVRSNSKNITVFFILI